MELKFKVSGIIARPVHEVFEAVADPEKLSGYFTTGGARGRLEKGATVTWDFADFPGAFPVQVIDVVEDEKIVLEWAAADGSSAVETGKHPGSVGYNTVVTMSLLRPMATEPWSVLRRRGGEKRRPGWLRPMAIAWAGAR